MTTERKHVEALPDSAEPDAAKLDGAQMLIGDPFAMVSGCVLLERNDAAGIPGACFSAHCECGLKFRIDLTSATPSYCPQCNTGFTHVLIVCPVDDGETPGDAVAHILEVNGYQPPDDDDTDDGDGTDETEDEPDDDDTDDDEQPRR